jgi:uncharacterized protein DUF6600/FecR-like protein
MKTRLSFDRIILCLAALVCAGNLAWAQEYSQEYSHVRIVRLSFEEGTVTLARPNVPGAEEASANTPIQEGFVLSTAESSFAEVEFENTSTARVGQLSQLIFNQLALDANGNKLNGMELGQGYATFTISPENADVYQVRAGMVTVTPTDEKAVRFRVDVDGAKVRVEVFKGTAEVAGSFGQQRLAKNTVLEFNPNEDNPLFISHGITKDAWDEWVEQREDEAQLARRKAPPGNYTSQINSYMYGWNDLYYYGSWGYIPGYGSCWFPTVGYGWVPFSYGQWAWYPSFGYTWISSEPWGWLPFHYGGWIYEPGFGWAWVPSDFGAWSPGLVSWYQGQTWVAWSPRGLRPRPGGGMLPAQSGCPGPSCTTVVSTATFRSGLPVQGHRLPGVDVTATSEVEKLTITPPDRIHAGSASTAEAGTAGVRTPSATSPRANFGAAGDATDGRVVFDSKEGRFVNGRDGGAPAPSRLPSVNTDADQGRGETPSTRPVRVGAPAASSGPASEVSHHASPRSGVESPRSQGTFERAVGSWGSGNSGGGQSSHTDSPRSSSGGWSAPSSSGGGSRSSGVSGSSGSSSPHMGGGSSGGGGGGGGGGGHTSSSTPHGGGSTPRR